MMVMISRTLAGIGSNIRLDGFAHTDCQILRNYSNPVPKRCTKAWGGL